MAQWCRQILLVLIGVALILGPVANPVFAQQLDNDELQDIITGLGVTHNVAFPPSLAPLPAVSLPAGAIAYSSNLGLKYTPPVLRPPGTVGHAPDSVGSCSYGIKIAGSAEKTRQDYLGLLHKEEGSFVWSNFLKSPDVYHVNTDVKVGVYYGGELLSGDVSLPVGNNTLTWRGDTLVTPVLDFPPWFALLAKPVEASSRKLAAAASNSAARRATLEVIFELFINLGLEGAVFGVDWAVLDGVPTPTLGTPIRNQQFQTVRIYDTVAPTATLTQSVFRVEATQVGGEYLRDHIRELRDALIVSDNCGRVPFVSYSAPSFMPLGQTTTVDWTIRDAGPVDINGGFNTVFRQQQIIVEDTLPPIILPPPGRVVESSSALNVPLGRAAVFDLADVRPTISNDGPASFAVDSRTRVTWSATDSSKNSSSRSQWVTVKAPGTNTVPVATPTAVDALSFAPIDIEIIGGDQDLLSGRYDQLSFAISEPPSNGFFVAPLFPYFIEDHRVENAFGLTKPELNQFLRDQCSADPNNYVPPIDFVSDPRYISVTDNGNVYVLDSYFICNRSGGNIEDRPRISKFIKDAEGRLEYVGQTFTLNRSVTDSLFIDANESVYYITPEAGSTFGSVRRCDSTLQSCETFDLETTLVFGDPRTNRLQADPSSIVADTNDVLYAVDGQQSLIAYDLQDVDSSNRPARLGPIAGPGDMLSGGVQRKDMAIDSERNLYVSDIEADRIYKFSASRIERNADGSVDFRPGEFIGWMGRCEQNLTSTRACDEIEQRSFGYSCTAALCGVATSNGVQPGQFNSPRGIAIDANNILYVTDYDNLRVQRFTADGFFAGEAVSECDGTCFVLGDFGKPEDITVNRQFFYVLDKERDLLHVFETTPISAFDDEALTPTQTATVTYQSNNNFTGNDAFGFTVGDGLAVSAEALVSIAVTRNFRSPVGAEGQVFSATEDQVLNLVVDAFDPDADDHNNLSYSITRAPEHGSLTGIGPDYAYQPDVNYFGSDSFAFSVSDGQMDSGPVEAVIEVAAVNDLPVLTVSSMAARFGTGFPVKLEVNFDDVDFDDRHVYGIDWGPGEWFRTGRALPPEQTAAPGEVTFIQSTGGSAVLLHELTYFSPGSRTITICASDQPGVATLSSCSDPRVTVMTQHSVSIEAMISKAIAVTDMLPTTTAELGVETTDPVMDGEEFGVMLTLFNLEPNDISNVLDANNIVMSAQLGSGLEFAAAPVVTDGQASGISCSTAGQQLSCSYAQLLSAGETMVTVRVRGDGTLAEDRAVSLLVMADSDEDDHNGMVANLKQYTITVNPNFDADGDGVANGIDAFPGDPSESVDTDADGVGNNADTDDDNDLMPDAWEQRFGLDSLNGADNGADADGDQISNVDEFLAGTRPDTSDSDRDQQADNVDNCPLANNANQYDQDNDSIGDACDRKAFAAVAVLDDLDGNQALDYALVKTSGGAIEAFIKDSATDFSSGADRINLGSDSDRRALDVAGVGVADGRNSSALALLYSDSTGALRVQLTRATDGALEYDTEVFDAQWLFADAIKATVSAQAEYWVAAKNWVDGRVQVRRVDLATGGVSATHDFSANLEPDSIAASGAGNTIMLLATHAARGDLLVDVRDLSTDAVLGGIALEDARALTNLATHIDVGLAIASQSIDGDINVSVLDADGSTLVIAFAALDSGWVLLDLATVAEWSGNGDAIALAAVSDAGEMRITLYNPADGSIIDEQSFHASEFTPRGFSTSVQLNGSSSELGVLAAGASGKLSLEVRDVESGAASRLLTAASMNPPPPPPPPPPTPSPSGGGGGGLGWIGLLAMLLLLGSRRRSLKSMRQAQRGESTPQQVRHNTLSYLGSTAPARCDGTIGPITIYLLWLFDLHQRRRR